VCGWDDVELEPSGRERERGRGRGRARRVRVRARARARDAFYIIYPRYVWCASGARACAMVNRRDVHAGSHDHDSGSAARHGAHKSSLGSPKSIVSATMGVKSSSSIDRGNGNTS